MILVVGVSFFALLFAAAASAGESRGGRSLEEAATEFCLADWSRYQDDFGRTVASRLDEAIEVLESHRRQQTGDVVLRERNPVTLDSCLFVLHHDRARSYVRQGDLEKALEEGRIAGSLMPVIDKGDFWSSALNAKVENFTLLSSVQLDLGRCSEAEQTAAQALQWIDRFMSDPGYQYPQDLREARQRYASLKERATNSCPPPTPGRKAVDTPRRVAEAPEKPRAPGAGEASGLPPQGASRLPLPKPKASEGAIEPGKNDSRATAKIGAEPPKKVERRMDGGVDARVERGQTKLIAAAHALRVDSVRSLIENGADVDLGGERDPGYTPLHAALNPYVDEPGGPRVLEIVRLLLEGGATDIKDGLGDSPFHDAAEYPDPRFVKLFIARGFHLEVTDAQGRTPLMRALYKANFDRAFKGVVAALLEAGADVNHADNDLNTPLIQAMDADIEIVRMLLERGADPNARNKYGLTALQIVKKTGKKGYKGPVIALLQQYGAR